MTDLTAPGGFALGVDLGTSNTVAVLRWPDGRTRPLLFDGQPLMPSGVFLDAGGGMHVGRDAQRLAQADPARFEPNPKRRIDEAAVLLGDREAATVDLLAALLAAVARAAVEAVGFLPPAVLTHPAAWGVRRRDTLAQAAARAGWPAGTILVPEPVAAARYFAEVLRRPVPVGSSLAVFDFGGGTLDIAVVRNEGTGFVVAGSGGVAELGGLDLDSALVDHLGAGVAAVDPGAWQALTRPATAAQWRSRQQFWDDVRGAKEMLSRTTVAPVPVPGVEQAVHLTRDELEQVVTPLLRRGVQEAAAVIARAGLHPAQLAGLFLVGGSSRVPLVARLLHADLGVAPTVLEQPELPVAEGALAGLRVTVPAATARATVPVSAAPQALPLSAPGSPVAPVSAVPGGPVSAPPGPPPLPGPHPPAYPPKPAAPRRTLLWIGVAAVVALVGVVVAAVLVLGGRRYTDVEFRTFDQGRRLMSTGEEQPTDTFTQLVGDRAYLAYVRDDKRLEIAAVEVGSGRELWRRQAPGTADRWEGIVGLPDAVVTFADVPSSSPTRRQMVVLDGRTGKELWNRTVLADDTVHFFASVLVLADSAEHRILGLDLRSGRTTWEHDDPKSELGTVETRVLAVTTAADVSGAARDDGVAFAPDLDDDQRIVQIGADKSARVIDVPSGRIVRTRGNVADPDDVLMAYEGRLFVAPASAAYRLVAYDLAKLGEPVNLYTPSDGDRNVTRVAPCGDDRVCLLDSANYDRKTTEVVAVDAAEGGEQWRRKAPDAKDLVPLADGVLVRASAAEERSTVYASDGEQKADREGAAVRLDAANLLLFSVLSTFPDDSSVAGVHARSGDVTELGLLKKVRPGNCSWSTELLVCPSAKDFVIHRFAS